MLIRDTARAVAGHRWIEGRLFELTGSWAGAAASPGLTRSLAAQSRHHGWRAALWAELVPVLHDVEPGAPESADAALVDRLDGTVATLRIVLAELVDRYEQHLAMTTEVSDAPVARALRLALVDTRADLGALPA